MLLPIIELDEVPAGLGLGQLGGSGRWKSVMLMHMSLGSVNLSLAPTSKKEKTLSFLLPSRHYKTLHMLPSVQR